MDCAETRALLGAYVDGELSHAEATAVSAHLASCAACAREYESMLETVRALRGGLVQYRAPDLLRARLRTALREEAAQPAAQPSPPPRRTPRSSWGAPWRSIAAGLLVAVASSGVTLVATRRGAVETSVADQVLTSHIRSLMPEHLTDVRSNDQHNVKPWFNGRLDYSPTVPRFDDAGFPLVGGRLDYVTGRPVAVVVYSRRQHLINSFSWPSSVTGDAPRTLAARNGYNMLHWRSGGVEHWVASDLNAAELTQFSDLLRRADSR